MSDTATIEPADRRFGTVAVRALLAALMIGPALAYLVAGIVYNLIPTGPGLLNAAGNATGTDFIAFYAASEALWHHGVSAVYDTIILNGIEDAVIGVDLNPVTFHYPPPYLLAVAPLSSLPYMAALGMWIAALSAGYFIALKRLGPPTLVLVLLIAFPGTVQSIITGQNGLLTAALLAAGLAMLDRHPRWSGIFFAMMIYKPHLAALVPLCLFAARRYETLFAMIVAGAGLAVASTVLFGYEAWIHFLNGLPLSLSYIIDARVPFERMPTVFVMVYQATGKADLAHVVQITAAIVTASACALTWRRSEDIAVRALAITAGVPLMSPYGFDYDLAILAIPLALIGGRVFRRKTQPGDILLTGLLWVAPVLFWFVSRALDQQVGPLLFAGLVAVALARAVNPADRQARAQ